jgi:hypothetical protein
MLTAILLMLWVLRWTFSMTSDEHLFGPEPLFLLHLLLEHYLAMTPC